MAEGASGSDGGVAPTGVDVFLSYSAKDEALAGELESHLASLKREGAIRTWQAWAEVARGIREALATLGAPRDGEPLTIVPSTKRLMAPTIPMSPTAFRTWRWCF